MDDGQHERPNYQYRLTSLLTFDISYIFPSYFTKGFCGLVLFDKRREVRAHLTTTNFFGSIGHRLCLSLLCFSKNSPRTIFWSQVTIRYNGTESTDFQINQFKMSTTITTSGPNGKAWILNQRAMGLANYPHARRVGNMVYVSGISSRKADNTYEGVCQLALILLVYLYWGGGIWRFKSGPHTTFGGVFKYECLRSRNSPTGH